MKGTDRRSVRVVARHGAAAAPVVAVIAVKEALVDQVAPQGHVVIKHGPQYAVDFLFWVVDADLELPGDVIEQHKPLGSFSWHGRDPAVQHESLQHRLVREHQLPSPPKLDRQRGYPS